jgi:hypothetical protein
MYSPYWSLNYTKRLTCGSYDWKVTDNQANVVYATKHIYELQLIVKFLVLMKENNAAVKALVGGRSNVICPLLLNKLLFMKGPGGVRANMRFGAGDIQTRVGSRPIDELVDAMSGGIANCAQARRPTGQTQ